VEIVVRAGRGVTETDAETGICVVGLHEQRPSSTRSQLSTLPSVL
jgi:hypothetical protein